MIIYDGVSVTRRLTFEIGRRYYLTIVMSNCSYNGSTFLTVDDLFTLENSIHNEIDNVSDLQFRGIGSTMVRGDTNSLTLGVSASYYNTTADIDGTPAITLRNAIDSALSNIPSLVYSELRVETNLIQHTTY
jgi:hypothetical protein